MHLPLPLLAACRARGPHSWGACYLGNEDRHPESDPIGDGIHWRWVGVWDPALRQLPASFSNVNYLLHRTRQRSAVTDSSQVTIARGIPGAELRRAPEDRAHGPRQMPTLAFCSTSSLWAASMSGAMKRSFIQGLQRDPSENIGQTLTGSGSRSPKWQVTSACRVLSDLTSQLSAQGRRPSPMALSSSEGVGIRCPGRQRAAR